MPTSGTAPNWVLLHGTPLDPAVWDAVRAHLGVAATAPDLNRPVRPGAMMQQRLAEAVLADAPGDGLIVVGHSLGGQVALEMTLLAPHRVARLILVCTRDVPAPEFGEAAGALRAGTPVDIEAGVRRWFTPDEIAEDGPVVRYARQRLATVSPSAYADSLQALADYDRRAAVAAIRTPAVLLCGRLDEGCTPSVMSTLAADLSDATLDVVDEWAHMSPFVDPAGFADRLRAAAGR